MRKILVHFGKCGKSAFERVHLDTLTFDADDEGDGGINASSSAEFLRNLGYYTVVERVKDEQ